MGKRASLRRIQLPFILMYLMPTTLDQLVAEARLRVEHSMRTVDYDALKRRADKHVPRGFRANLVKVSASAPAVIAELKKASPSKGVIRDPLHVARIASELEQAGAAALSVLTEEEHFNGSLANLVEASAATSLPCLRKDFIVHEFQIVEAKAHGADAILLIVAALSQNELMSLLRAAKERGMDVLVEAHDVEEVQRAVDAGAEVIGVNSRDLRTFQVNIETAMELGKTIPSSIVRVAESGIHSAEDMSRLRGAGFSAFLVGESLMRADSPGAMLRELLQPSTVRGD